MAKAHTLIDNFNDNSIDTAKWSPAVGLAREVNGRIEIRLPSGVSGNGAMQSQAAYDLTGSAARVELVRAPVHSPSVETALLARGAGGNYLKLTLNDGTLSYSQHVVSTSTSVELAPYEPDVHRWLQLRELQGTLYCETSSNGETWTTLFSTASPFSLSAVYLEFGAASYAALPSPGVAIFDNFNVQGTSLSRRVEERRLSAAEVRGRATAVAAARRHDEHANNNDEVNYPDRLLVGNYSKSLKHDALGDPDPGSYATLLRALESRDPHDFEEIILASSTALRLTNPQAGLTFEIAGPDAQERTLPPAPRFDSEVAAHEMGELYWMAVARDVPFVHYTSSTEIADAVSSLNSEFPRFGGTVPVTTANVFRGIYPGEQVGPYVSQFLLKGNTDPRKPDGLGKDAIEGYISYGSRYIDQRIIPAVAGVDYLTDFATWLNAQNGADTRGADSFGTSRRFIHNLRGGATFVHFDQVVDAFYNAAWILMSEPMGNQYEFLTGTGRPQIDLEFPLDQGNPYDPPGTAMDARKQAGFATFGPIHLLQALSEVLGRALRATWWQKWGVHRRLRPEEYGGRVHNQATGARTYPLHTSIVESLTGAPTTGMPVRLSKYFGNTGERFPSSYLLPQAYPEGAPTHPAYGAGHATGAGACATILKAFFDETKTIENPVRANDTGDSLTQYTGADATQMTVGGELNKLAGNIAIFRNAAGVHWRSDYTESLPLGEAIAIGLLQEMSLGFNEDDAFFELTRFDGQKIRIFDGKVVPVVV